MTKVEKNKEEGLKSIVPLSHINMSHTLFSWCFTEELSFDTIRRDSLKQDKAFQKLLRKQAKELENLKKKHQKERSTMQRQHCLVVDKLVACHDKEKLATEKSADKMIRKKR